MSDQQKMQLLERARSMGYSDQELLNMAQSQGYLPTTQPDPVEEEKQPSTPSVNRTKYNEALRADVGFDSSRYFGYNLFNPSTRNLSFETNLLIPVPDDFVIGPTDQLEVDIYGASERNFTTGVDLNGNLRLPNIGPVAVSGLTLTEAENRVRRVYSRVYPDLASPNSKTSLELSVKKVRTLKVNVVGELNMPGTYTVNGLSTVFNAIYVAGGPNEMGTLRNIKVFRNNELISTVDFYDFLINGVTRTNIRLQNDDVILVGPYLKRVELKGEVKRPGIYELKDGETFEDLLNFSGGFSEFAYREKVGVERVLAGQKVISDMYQTQYNFFDARPGDVYTVKRILDKYRNRVQIEGSVFRPGAYALTEGMKLSDLIELSDGLTGDAFMNRALIIRNTENLNTETITVDLNDIGSVDPELRPEDKVRILSIHDLKEERFVRISGEVNKPGVYRYSGNMSVQDLVFLANGVKQSAQLSKVEISRRPDNQSTDNLSEIILVSVDSSLSNDTGQETKLKPFDHVVVRRDPNYFEERTVVVSGEVEYPGTYTLQHDDERISSVINRAGGLKSKAYPQGATLIRKTEFFSNEQNIETLRQNLKEALTSLDTATLSDSDKIFVSQVLDELDNMSRQEFVNLNMANEAKKNRLSELAAKNPFLSDVKIKESESIALDFEQILDNPNSPEDFILEEGDIINVPKELKTVRLRGRVLFPNTVRFESGKSLKYFIDKAGGFDTRAKKSSTYVVYANGEVARTKSFLFFRSYPSIEPGSEVIVPVKPIKIPLAPSDLIGLSTGLATLALLVTQIYNNATP